MENITKKIIVGLSVIIALAILVFLSYHFLAPFSKIVYYRFASKLPGAEEATTFSPGKDNVLKIPSQSSEPTNQGSL